MSEPKQERRLEYAGLLREVQGQEGNKECQKHHHEERQAGNPGCVPDLWHENVQNRQGLGLLRHNRQNSKGLDFPGGGMASPFILPDHNKLMLPNNILLCYHD